MGEDAYPHLVAFHAGLDQSREEDGLSGSGRGLEQDAPLRPDGRQNGIEGVLLVGAKLYHGIWLAGSPSGSSLDS